MIAVAIALAAGNLRPAVASVAPLLEDVRVDLGLSGTAVSAFTALPVLCFGAGAFGAPRLARRFGSETSLVGALAALTVGQLVRLGPDTVTLFAGTLIAGAAIGIANVVIPAMVKRHFAAHAGLMMGLFVSATAIGAAVPAGATVPLARTFGHEWRVGMGVWAAPAAVACALWLGLTASRRRRSLPDDRTTDVPRSLRRDAIAWQVTAFMSLMSLNFYTLLSWLPSVYRSHGMTPGATGQLLSLMIVLSVPTALFIPSLLTRSARQGRFAVSAVGVTFAGVLGVALSPTSHPVLWAALIGLGGGASLPIAHTLVILRSRDAKVAAQLSAMSQSVGYALAAVGPFGFGLLHDIGNGWTPPFAFLLVLLVPQAVAGAAAGRDAYVHERRGSATT